MKKLDAPIPRVALTVPEAAAALGVGPDFFDENIRPELKVIRRGRKRLIPVGRAPALVRGERGAGAGMKRAATVTRRSHPTPLATAQRVP